jgi:integrase
MSLYKRGGVWWSYIWIHNVRHGRSLKTGNKREAALREREFQEELDMRRHKQIQLNPEMPFAALATRFMGSASFKPYHENQLKSLLPYFGTTPLTELNRVQADTYRRYRKNKDGVVDATVNRDLETMRRILFFGVDSGIKLVNPMSRVQMVRARRKRRPVLSVEEEPKLLAAATEHLRPIVVAAIDTGMRRGELFSQKAEDVDLTRGVLYVTKSKTAGGEQREIPLTARMQQLIPTLAERGLLFTYKGEPIRKIRRSWATAVKNSGIRPLLFKQLRHTFNTRLMEAGVIQDVRMALMGHAQGTARTTNDLYTHIELPVMREAIQKLEAWCAKQTQQFNKEDEQTTDDRSEEQLEPG